MHNELAGQVRKQDEAAEVRALSMALSMGAPVELVICTQFTEQVRQVRFTRDPRFEGGVQAGRSAAGSRRVTGYGS